MRRVFYSLVFIILAQSGLVAQFSSQDSTQACPTVSIDSSYINDPGERPVTFTVVVAGGDSKVNPKFAWSFEGGKIMTGQGTSTITVGELDAGAALTATVQVGGFPGTCGNTASLSFNIEYPRHADKFDEYGNVGEEVEMARLDNFAIELSNNPSAIGYVIAYGGRRAYASEALKRLKHVKDYLVNIRAFSENRIIIVDGGYREELTIELYIAPPNEIPPVAAPTVSPDEVQIIQIKPTQKKRQPRRH